MLFEIVKRQEVASDTTRLLQCGMLEFVPSFYQTENRIRRADATKAFDLIGLAAILRQNSQRAVRNFLPDRTASQQRRRA